MIIGSLDSAIGFFIPAILAFIASIVIFVLIIVYARKDKNINTFIGNDIILVIYLIILIGSLLSTVLSGIAILEHLEIVVK